MNLDNVILDCKENAPLYWSESYLQTNETNLTKVVFEDKKNVYLITEKTIFHPKYGGQPSDNGRVFSKDFEARIGKAMHYKGFIILSGKVVRGIPVEGEVVEEINWPSRYLMMRRHTASHLFDHALRVTLNSNVETLESWIGDSWYIAYKGPIPEEDELKTALELENEYVRYGYDVSTRLVNRSKLLEEAEDSPNLSRLPKLDLYRLVKINNFEDIACSGTHLKNISEIGKVAYVKSESQEESYRVYLRLE